MDGTYQRPKFPTLKPKQYGQGYSAALQVAPLTLKVADIMQKNKLYGTKPGEMLQLQKPTLEPTLVPENAGLAEAAIAAPEPVPVSPDLAAGAVSTEGLEAFNLSGTLPGAVEKIGAGSLSAFAGAGGTEAAISSGIAAGADVGMAPAASASMLSTVGGLAGSAVSGGMWGAAAPQLVEAIHHGSMENLGHNVTLGLVKSEQTAKEVGGGVTGALAGAAAGATYGSSYPVVGTVIGAVVGGIAGVFGVRIKKCIIISACCGADSHEVRVARQYRDAHMDEEELTGYYALCIFLVPYIRKHDWFRGVVKRLIVDRLVDHGEVFMGMKGTYRHMTSKIVTRAFLGLCRHVGRGVDAVLEQQEA